MTLQAAACPAAIRRLTALQGTTPTSQPAAWTLRKPKPTSVARGLLLPLRLLRTALARAWHQVAASAIVQQTLHIARVLGHLFAFLRERAARRAAKARGRAAATGGSTALVDASATALHLSQLKQLHFHIRHGTLHTFLGVLERALVLSDLFWDGINVEMEHDVQGDWRIVAHRSRAGSSGAGARGSGATVQLDERTPWLLLQDVLVTRCAGCCKSPRLVV